MPTLVEDLREVFPSLPTEFLDTLLDRCLFCGSKTIINEALTGLHCGNPRCSSKIAMRIRAICSKLDIKGFGPATIYDFIDSYQVTNPMDIFDFKSGMYVSEGTGFETSQKIIDQIITIKTNQKFLLWEAVALQNLPGIQTKAQKIFSGYDSIEKAYEDIEDGGVEFINERLGLAPTVTSVDDYLLDESAYGVSALTTYQTLMEFKDDVIIGVNYLNIIPAAEGTEITVVVSDQVGGRWSSKNEFYTYCKETFAGRFHFNFAGSVSKKSTEFLVWAGADGSPARYTSKVSKVEGYNASGSVIPVLTGEQFVSFLEGWDGSSEGKSSALNLNSDVPEDDTFTNFSYSNESGGLL